MIKFSFFIKKILKIFNIKISNYFFYEKVYRNNKYYLYLKILKNFGIKKNFLKNLDSLEYAKSELGQDLLALNYNNFKISVINITPSDKEVNLINYVEIGGINVLILNLRNIG
jgi:hypothetical protein